MKTMIWIDIKIIGIKKLENSVMTILLKQYLTIKVNLSWNYLRHDSFDNMNYYVYYLLRLEFIAVIIDY